MDKFVHNIYNIVNQAKDFSDRMDPYVFVITLVIIIASAVIIIFQRLQESKDRQNNNQLEKYKIDIEAEIIKVLKELVNADEQNRYRDDKKDDSGRRYVYQSGDKEYALQSYRNYPLDYWISYLAGRFHKINNEASEEEKKNIREFYSKIVLTEIPSNIKPELMRMGFLSKSMDIFTEKGFELITNKATD